jgi:hypothetical protein
MKRICKATGVPGLLLGMALGLASASSVSAQQTQDSSGFRPTTIDSVGTDSLVQPGYRAMLEDTTGGLGADSTRGSNGIGSVGDTTSPTGLGGGADTTGLPARRSEDSTKE